MSECNCGYVESLKTDQPFQTHATWCSKTTRPICDGCGNEIDPDCCGCGSPITHSSWEGHSPVPMGCDCNRAVYMWLDDVRPAPEGWTHVKTVAQAQALMTTRIVQTASLDHDLGACEACLKGRTPEQWLDESNYTEMPNCDHYQTGYTLVCWMEEHDCWPLEKPTVHSANPVGRAKMQVAINRRFP